MPAVGIWFLVTGIAVCVLVSMLAIVNIVAAYRSLLNEGVPMPGYVLYQRTIGRLVPGVIPSLDRLIGRAAFLSWDIRWVSCGNTTARVMGVNSTEKALSLRLSKPIVLHAADAAPQVQLNDVRFIPTVVGRAGFGKMAVSGYLKPSLPEELSIKASIVVYPENDELEV